MNHQASRMNGRLGRPATTLHSSHCMSHPNLSPFELGCLALRIAKSDGVSVIQASQQIAQFRGAPSGPKVLAMRRHVRGLPLTLAV